jgi:hypothetical protein
MGRTTAVLYVIAGVLFVVARLALSRTRDARQAKGETDDGASWSLYHLFLASFLTLFAELAFIRWIAVEVRVFAYFKNLALLLCFLGLRWEKRASTESQAALAAVPRS